MGYILGLDPNKVDDSDDGPQFDLGSRGVASNGAEYIYLEADGAIDAFDAVIVHTDCGAEALTTTLATTDAGNGKSVAVAPGDGRSQAIATGDFFWACIYAQGTVGVKVNVAASCADFVQLYASSTAGHLDDALDADGAVNGIAITTAATASAQEEIAVINYPVIVNKAAA